jgi:glyoxylase I family protein
MKFEHHAVNVPDAKASVAWYVKHLGLQVIRSMPDEPWMTFLGDDTGRVFLELYTNKKVAIPDHQAAQPLNFHIAFVATDAKGTKAQLEAAGAKTFSEDTMPDGTVLVMMRDPWGVPLQFCQRAKPF